MRNGCQRTTARRVGCSNGLHAGNKFCQSKGNGYLAREKEFRELQEKINSLEAEVRTLREGLS